jgi:hypothetical protein
MTVLPVTPLSVQSIQLKSELKLPLPLYPTKPSLMCVRSSYVNVASKHFIGCERMT